MNEQAVKDSYELFKTGGYSKSFDEFVKLINTNPQALQDSYELFQGVVIPRAWMTTRS